MSPVQFTAVEAASSETPLRATFKVKLNGNDRDWDVERMHYVERVTAETQKKRGEDERAYVPDFNEKCANADY